MGGLIMQNIRVVLIRIETTTLLLSGWVSQSGTGLVADQYEWLERLGGLALAAIAMWRLMWYELPAWREELRLEREANKANADAIAGLSAEVVILAQSGQKELDDVITRLDAIQQTLNRR